MARDTYFRNTVGQEPWELRGTSSTAAATAVSGALPVGVITAYYGTAAPTGWLLCDGAAIPATYTTLIALVGANTPNLKGRVLVGLNGAETEFDTLGETGGAKTVALSTAELASHGHNHSHGALGTTQTADDNKNHQHGNSVGTANTAHTHVDTNDNQYAAAPGVGGFFTGDNIGNALIAHQHDYNHTHAADATAVGSGAAHQNLPPYIAINYIIKAT